MALKTSCPNCGQTLRAKDDQVGKTVRCAACSHRFVVSSILFGDSAAGQPSLEATSTRDDTATSSTVRRVVPTIGKVGRFELKQALGQGAFGTVYRAYDPVLDREVALKVPRFPPDQPIKTERFLREGKAAANLRHPNIVSVFESGQADGSAYIASEFVDGATMSAQVERERPSLRQAVAWVRDLANALDYAHTEGVIHRDIKPQNIMIGQRGRPQLMDFGLAKRVEEDATLTTDGAILGTPTYMALEQARGDQKAIGAHSDQYSLGIVLYELLTGRKPFEGPPHSVLAQVTAQEPPRPRKLDAGIPPDLEAVCLKAIEKEPRQRYATAGAFAADLERWLEGTPVTARPIGLVERARRWTQRNPLIAGLSFGLVAVLLLGLLGVGWQWRRASSNARLEAAARAEADRNRETAETARAEAERNRETAETARNEARQSEDRAVRYLYVADMNRAQQAFEAGDAGRVIELLERHRPQGDRDFRTFPWYYWWKQTHVYERQFIHAANKTSRPRTYATLTPDGTLVITASKRDYERPTTEIRFWDARTGAVRRTVNAPGQPNVLKCSPDGRWLAVGTWDYWTAKGAASLIEVATGKLSQTIRFPKPAVLSVSFNPDSTRLAVGGEHSSAYIHDLATGKVVTELPGHGGAAFTVCYSGDGTRLATYDGTIRIWNTADGTVLKQIKQSSGLVAFGGNNLALSPLGRAILLGDQGEVHILDPESGKHRGILSGHTAEVFTIVYSPDGSLVATGGGDRVVRVWNSQTVTVLHTLRGHSTRIVSLALSRDNRYLVSSEGNGTVLLWDLTRPLPSPTGEPAQEAAPLALSPDGRLLASIKSRLTVEVRDVRTRQVVHELPPEKQPPDGWIVTSLAFGPDGKRLAVGRFGPSFLWELATNDLKPLTTRPNYSPPRDLVLSPDGTLFAGGTEASQGKVGAIHLWDAMTGKSIRRFPENSLPLTSLAFSSDGKLITTGGTSARVLTYDPATGTPHEPLDSPNDDLTAVAFVPMTHLAAVGRADGTIGLWDLDGRQLVHTFRGHQGAITALVFSPDGKTLFSSGLDRMLYLWDMATRDPIGTLPGSAGRKWDRLLLSPDGRTLYGSSRTGPYQVWEAASDAEVARKE